VGRIAHIGLLANYNQWMNDKLYAAASTLTAAELAADRQAFFGSILATLNHLAIGDTLWLQRFAKHPSNPAALTPILSQPTPSSLKQQLFSDLQSLTAYRQWLDNMICSWAGALTETQLHPPLSYHNTQGIAARKDFFSLVMHFFNHQTHHRGQVTTLLSQAGVCVGVTDLLALIPNQLAD
jgi:uncharacterized damage-inducible protein DinB